jgi:hypothetical protein
MHSLIWFWTVGIHDAAWVQAFASVALVVLTLVTLVVLSIYAWDTHTLAKMSVEQIVLTKTERYETRRWKLQAALDCINKSRDRLLDILRLLRNGSFESKQYLPIYPENWPETTSVIQQLHPNMPLPLIELGASLQLVDSEVNAFLAGENNNERPERKKKLVFAVNEAMDKHSDAILLLKSLLINRPFSKSDE